MSSTRFNPPVPTFAEVDGSRAETPDSDGHIYPGENDYQGSTNKRTLGSYISSLTRGEVPTENVVEYNGPIPTHGNAYPIGDASGNPSATYTENGVEGGSVNALDNYSNSLLFNVPSTGKDLSSIINKGQLGEGQGRETVLWARAPLMELSPLEQRAQKLTSKQSPGSSLTKITTTLHEKQPLMLARRTLQRIVRKFRITVRTSAPLRLWAP